MTATKTPVRIKLRMPKPKPVRMTWRYVNREEILLEGDEMTFNQQVGLESLYAPPFERSVNSNPFDWGKAWCPVPPSTGTREAFVIRIGTTVRGTHPTARVWIRRPIPIHVEEGGAN